MTTEDKLRIEVEADRRARKWLEVQYIAAKTEYISGATAERNKAIDDVVKLVFEDDGDFKQYESPSSIMNKIKALKIK